MAFSDFNALADSKTTKGDLTIKSSIVPDTLFICVKHWRLLLLQQFNLYNKMNSKADISFDQQNSIR